MNLDQIFSLAIKKGASDIHLITNLPPILRIQGELKQVKDAETLNSKTIEDLIYKILNEPQKERLNQEKELDSSYEISDGSRFRVNCYFEKNELALAARIIPATTPNMKDLAMPEVVYDLTRLKQGLVLVTGPTGCGKSTSLAAMIELINNERSENIVTLEDPIEFVYAPKKSIISQRQLGRDMLSFAEGLKHALRQDPNVLLVGEMRDLETIATTITLAETGHLVFATLHTHNAGQTIDRIIDIFPPHQQEQVRLQLSLSLKAVISQHLIPTPDGKRIAVREIMLNNPAIANLIRENKVPQIKSVIQTSGEEGMLTNDQALKKLLQQELITKEIYKSFLEDKED
ncbi:MAG TPA: type IV pilus twitching motility protein PilT [bacterium]|nr:type IV pilus twitching motility protein PilT [bacterium]